MLGTEYDFHLSSFTTRFISSLSQAGSKLVMSRWHDVQFLLAVLYLQRKYDASVGYRKDEVV